jgi:hypothetical protein
VCSHRQIKLTSFAVVSPPGLGVGSSHHHRVELAREKTRPQEPPREKSHLPQVGPGPGFPDAFEAEAKV